MCILKIEVQTQEGSFNKTYSITTAFEDLALVCAILWKLRGQDRMDVLLDFPASVNGETVVQRKQDKVLLPFKNRLNASGITVRGAINEKLAFDVRHAP